MRAAIWPVLIPGPAQRSRTCSPGLRVEHLDHRGRAAALRGQLARLDQLRHAPRRCGPRRRSTPAAASGQWRRGLLRLDSGIAQRRQRRLAVAAQRVDPQGRSRPARCRPPAASGRSRRRAPPTTSAPARAAPSGRRRRAPGSSRRRAGSSTSASRSRAARRRTALTRPAACAGAGALDQLDRLVDRGVVRRRVGEEQLVEAEPQGRRARAGRAAAARAPRAARSPRRRCRGAARRRRRGAAPGRARGRLPGAPHRPPRGRPARCRRPARRSRGGPRRRAPARGRDSRLTMPRSGVAAQVGVGRPSALPPAGCTTSSRSAPSPQPSSSAPHSAADLAGRDARRRPARPAHAESLPAAELEVGADVRGQGAHGAGQLDRPGGTGSRRRSAGSIFSA